MDYKHSLAVIAGKQKHHKLFNYTIQSSMGIEQDMFSQESQNRNNSMCDFAAYLWTSCRYCKIRQSTSG